MQLVQRLVGENRKIKKKHPDFFIKLYKLKSRHLYTLSDGGMMIRKVIESDTVDECIIVLDCPATAEATANEELTGMGLRYLC